MNTYQALYIILSILFTGFSVFAVIQYVYLYIRMPQKETFRPLMFSCSAFIYIIINALALLFSFIFSNNNMTRLFVILRELTPMLLLILAPYFLNQSLPLKEKVKKINQILFWIGMAFIIAVTAAAVLSPGHMITGTEVDTDNFSGIIYMPDISPLLVFRDIILIGYLLYTIAIILFSKIQRINYNPVKYSLIGLIILCYFLLNYLYFILFTGNQNGFGNNLFPHFAAGVIFFIIFLNFGLIDLFIKYNTQLKIVRKDLNRILYRDALLDIPNRMGFLKDLQSELNLIETNGGSFSLLILDIDDFSKLNQCFGENVGNEILKMLSKRLIEFFAWAGTIYRIGGDEFVFILKGINTIEEIKSLAGKIVASLRNSFSISGVSYMLTASIGIMQIPNDGENTENILNNAYTVIGSAKKIKNTFAVFTRQLIDDSSRKIHIVNLLRSCIERDEFTLFYQPIVDINKKLIHAESLLRCTNVDPSIGGPGTFIPIIEQAGLITEVDNMVIRKAFHDMEMLIKRRFNISINLSANQINNPAYSDFLSSFAEQHGIENRQIILEVTESTLMENMSVGRENLLKLKNSGFNIAIDDFGKGFSSLTYLAELPVDILKMDMVFVHSVPGDSKKESMVKHIIEMAHSLNLKIVAEGFELPEQFEFFNMLGCDLFQGYFFSRPMPLDKLLVKYPD